MNPLLSIVVILVILPTVGLCMATLIYRVCRHARERWPDDDEWEDDIIPAKSEHDYYGDM